MTGPEAVLEFVFVAVFRRSSVTVVIREQDSAGDGPASICVNIVPDYRQRKNWSGANFTVVAHWVCSFGC